MFSYTVRCRFLANDEELAIRWLEWLNEVHIAEVIESGAASAEIFKMSGADLTYEIRYEFGSETEFRNYEECHAPRLRADGLKAFPLDLGLEYSRTTGESVSRF